MRWLRLILWVVLNLITATHANSIATTNFNGTISYTVDTKERLTQETSSRFGGYVENNVWDAASNPTTYRNNANRTYNGSNQRTSGTSFEYDGNGNPTKYNNTAATFDNENRMTAYTNGYQNTFGHRADGLRAWKQYVSGGQPKKRYYLYDGGNPVVELDTSGNVVATNVYAPDGLVGRTWGASGQTHNRYYLFDWQGNLAVTMGDATTVRSGWAFNAWGQVNSINPYTADSFWDDCFGYNARWGSIKETSIGGTYAGMYYCQNRYYDPANGRWLNRDPIGYAGGMNLYGYCGGGPVGAADPLGLIVRRLTDTERGWIQGRIDGLSNHGYGTVARRLQTRLNQNRILMDTDENGTWVETDRSGNHYLHPSFLDPSLHYSPMARNLGRPALSCTHHDAWAEGVLVHEDWHTQQSAFEKTYDKNRAERAAWTKAANYYWHLAVKNLENDVFFELFWQLYESTLGERDLQYPQ